MNTGSFSKKLILQIACSGVGGANAFFATITSRTSCIGAGASAAPDASARVRASHGATSSAVNSPRTTTQPSRQYARVSSSVSRPAMLDDGSGSVPRLSRRRAPQGKGMAGRWLHDRVLEHLEPVLTPERLAAVEEERRAEHLTVDRFLREALPLRR